MKIQIFLDVFKEFMNTGLTIYIFHIGHIYLKTSKK